jgi:hypothetical protein
MGQPPGRVERVERVAALSGSLLAEARLAKADTAHGAAA